MLKRIFAAVVVMVFFAIVPVMVIVAVNLNSYPGQNLATTNLTAPDEENHQAQG